MLKTQTLAVVSDAIIKYYCRLSEFRVFLQKRNGRVKAAYYIKLEIPRVCKMELLLFFFLNYISIRSESFIFADVLIIRKSLILFGFFSNHFFFFLNNLQLLYTKPLKYLFVKHAKYINLLFYSNETLLIFIFLL